MEINICYGITDDYCQHCACSIASILYNASPEDNYIFHIISNDISEYNKNFLKQLSVIRPFDINYYKIDVSNPDTEMKMILDEIGISFYFHINMFKLIECDKILYLHTDTIVRKNIANLYKINVERYACAGVRDIIHVSLKEQYDIPEESEYINGGVLLLNLDYCRKHNVIQKYKEYIAEFWTQKCGVQAIFNKVFQKKIKAIDLTWNFMYPFRVEYDDVGHYDLTSSDPSLVHYITDNNKPWKIGSPAYFKDDYFKYLKLTPYVSGYILDNLKVISDIIVEKSAELSNYVNYMNEQEKYNY